MGFDVSQQHSGRSHAPGEVGAESVEGPPVGPRSSRRAPAIVVLTCLIIGGLLALHFVMTFLYVAPRNPISARVEETIGSYMLPYFHQDWKLFAPEPMKTDIHLLVRAKVVDAKGRQQVTSWLDVTGLELARVRGHLLPDRASRLSEKVAGSLSQAAARQEQAAADPQQQLPPPEQAGQQKIDEAFARMLATRAARAQWDKQERGEQVTEIQIRFAGYVPPAPSFAGSRPSGDAEVIQHDLPWWPAAAVTPAELAAWKEVYR